MDVQETNDAEAIALRALGWTLGDDSRVAGQVRDRGDQLEAIELRDERQIRIESDADDVLTARRTAEPLDVERVAVDLELAGGRQVLDALATAHRDASGAVELDGQMIDEAVAVAARRTLAKAGAA